MTYEIYMIDIAFIGHMRRISKSGQQFVSLFAFFIQLWHWGKVICHLYLLMRTQNCCIPVYMYCIINCISIQWYKYGAFLVVTRNVWKMSSWLYDVFTSSFRHTCCPVFTVTRNNHLIFTQICNKSVSAFRVTYLLYPKYGVWVWSLTIEFRLFSNVIRGKSDNIKFIAIPAKLSCTNFCPLRYLYTIIRVSPDRWSTAIFLAKGSRNEIQ